MNTNSGYTCADQERYDLYLQILSQKFKQAWNDKSKKYTANMADFEKLKIIGTGTFGVVYLVKRIVSGKYYAMKSLEKEKIVKLQQIEQSFYEKKILSSLNFPFVIYMKYFFQDNVYLYYILPFIRGGEMFMLLSKAGRLTEAASKFYGGQIVLAIEYLHACELVYRDLKPENIVIDGSGYIKITDFGLCKLLHERTWTLCGTPDYLAPEIILSKGYGQAADWWAFGVLLYEMNSGYPPFFSTDPMRIFEKIVYGNYRYPSSFSKELKDLIGHLLQVDTSKRYGTLRNGILDLKNHKWFKDIVWDILLNKSLPPPFVPEITSPEDTKYFDSTLTLAERDIKSSACLYEKEFADF